MTAAEYSIRVQFGTFFGQPTWVDLTGYVDTPAGDLEIVRGRQNEAGTVTPTRLTVPLINDDGQFTPGRSASQWYPWVQDGAPVEVTAYIPAADGNLEDNPSHEFGISEWAAAGPGAAPIVTQEFYGTGQLAMRVVWQLQASGSAAQRRIYGLTPGVTYTASRLVYTFTGNADVRLAVGDGVSAVGTLVTTKNAWVRASVTFTATARSHVLQVQTPTSPAGGTCWTDSGRVEVGTVANIGTADTVGALRISRFTGKALEWPTGWSGGAADVAQTLLVAVGITHRLGDRFGSLNSFVVEESLLDNPLVLLPLNESDGATQAGNLGSDQRAAAVVNQGGTGTIEFGSGTGPPADGSGSLVLTRASTSAGYYLRAAAPVFSDALTVEAFIATTVADGTIADAGIPVNGDPQLGSGMVLRVSTGGKLEWRSDGTLTVLSPQTITDGRTHHVAAVYRHTGTQHTVTIYVDGEAAASGAVAATWQLVAANWVQVGGAQKLAMFTGTINHVAVYPTALPADRIRAHYQAGVTGFGGERADQRVSRLAAYANLQSLTPAARSGVWVLDDAAASVLGTTTVLGSTDLDIDAGSSRIWGQGGGGFTPLSGMEDVADTEGGIVLEDRSGFLDFHGRARRYNRPPAVRIDLADGDVQADLTAAYDDQDVVNDATVTTQDGAVLRYVDQPSVDQRGTYAASGLDLLTRDAVDAFSAASWMVRHNSAPATKYRSVTVDLTAAPAYLTAAVLRADVGDRLDLLGLPASAPATTAALFVEGYTERAGADGVTVSFNTSSADGYQVWTLDNPTMSVLGSTTLLAW